MHWRAPNLFARRPATSQSRSWALRRCYSSQKGSESTTEEVPRPPQNRRYITRKGRELTFRKFSKPLRFLFHSSQDRRASSIRKNSKPLRILFCGSDEFSCSSLRTLHNEQRRDPKRIASIDVLCRPGKPSGRNLKQIREAPIKAVAQQLGLPVHERDTFTGWDLPKPQGESINLIIAVSFGLFVPPRILKSAEYGGLNVHPSILPNFRGPAPLQWTIISNAQQCGVTLQSLDQKSFDHGVILAQTPPRGLPIPLGNKCTYDALLNYLTPIAANMLLQGIRQRVFAPPLIDVGWLKHIKPSKATDNAKLTKIIHAPKITSADRRIKWEEEGAIPIERRYRALGRLWTEVLSGPDTKKRIVFEDMEIVPKPEAILQLMKSEKGIRRGRLNVGEEKKRVIRFFATSSHNGDLKPRFFVIDGDAIIINCIHDSLRVRKITVEGKGAQHARQVFEGFKEWDVWKIVREDFHVIVKKNDDVIGEGADSESERTAEEGADKASDKEHETKEKEE